MLKPTTRNTVWIFHLRECELSRSDIPNLRIHPNRFIPNESLHADFPSPYEGVRISFAHVEWFTETMQALWLWVQKRAVAERESGHIEEVWTLEPCNVVLEPIPSSPDAYSEEFNRRVDERTRALLVQLLRTWWNTALIGHSDPARLLADPAAPKAEATYYSFARIREVHFRRKDAYDL